MIIQKIDPRYAHPHPHEKQSSQQQIALQEEEDEEKGARKLGLALTSTGGLAAGVGRTVSTFTPLPRRKCTKTLETAQPKYRDKLLTPLPPSQFLREKVMHIDTGATIRGMRKSVSVKSEIKRIRRHHHNTSKRTVPSFYDLTNATTGLPVNFRTTGSKEDGRLAVGCLRQHLRRGGREIILFQALSV